MIELLRHLFDRAVKPVHPWLVVRAAYKAEHPRVPRHLVWSAGSSLKERD